MNYMLMLHPRLKIHISNPMHRQKNEDDLRVSVPKDLDGRPLLAVKALGQVQSMTIEFRRISNLEGHPLLLGALLEMLREETPESVVTLGGDQLEVEVSATVLGALLVYRHKIGEATLSHKGQHQLLGRKDTTSTVGLSKKLQRHVTNEGGHSEDGKSGKWRYGDGMESLYVDSFHSNLKTGDGNFKRRKLKNILLVVEGMNLIGC